MSKSIKLKNDNYWDSSSIVVGKIKLSDKFYHNNTWQRSYTIGYDENRPKLIYIRWEQAFIVYSLYRGKIVELGNNKEYGSDGINYTINTQSKTVTFNLSNTGVITVLDI